MMKIYNWSKISPKTQKKLLKRSSVKLDKVFPQVKPVLEQVKEQGDKALQYWTEKFDKLKIKNFLVSKREIKEAWFKTDKKLLRAINRAAENIKKFHQNQVIKERPVSTMPGVKCWREVRPIGRVGLYIPKGLVSTVLMLGIPAKIVGCREIIICSPPKISKEILCAAKLIDIKKVFQIGGAQAIGAMAYGTQTVPKADKIFGPGNQYVTAAKLLVSVDPEGAAIDLPAGPSEVLVVADETADPVFVAADLLSQAEHGQDSQVVLVSISPDLIKKVKKELKRQLLDLPKERKNPAGNSLQHSFCLITESINKAIVFANLYAPEHLILNLKSPHKYIAKIKNAGSVFVGKDTPESVGDYASGTNHVLPTSGWARSYSGVSVDNFIKKITFQELSKTGLKNIAKTVEALADIEWMPAHKRTITLRSLRHVKPGRNWRTNDIKLICQLEESWHPETIKVKKVEGGETNNNYRVENKAGIWFVRVPYEADIIDREIEGANILALKGFPQLAKILPNYHIYLQNGRNILLSSFLKGVNVAAPDGTMVTDYIKGRKIDIALLEREEIQEQLVSTLHTFHNSGVKFVNNYDPFQNEILKYKNRIRNPLQLISREDLKEVERAEEIAGKGLPQEASAVSTHNDLIFSNLFLGEDNKIYLLDWEYAGFNIRGIHYDFGSLLGENLFHKRPLTLEVYRKILEKACQMYGRKFDVLRAYYGALTNVIVTFWWGLAQYFRATTEERRDYFRNYVPKRIQGIKFLNEIIERER